MTKLIYKINKKHVKQDKVKLIFERDNTNLLISKDGLHYLELDGKNFTNCQIQNGDNTVTRADAISKDYYEGTLSLDTPTLRLVSTKKLHDDIEKRLKGMTAAQYLVNKPIISNYKILVEGVFINGKDPMVGKEGDVMGITRSIKQLDSSEQAVDLRDEEKITNVFNCLFLPCDEQYVISQDEGILSVNIGVKEKINSNINIEQYISAYMNKIVNNSNHILYFVRIERGKSMNIFSIRFEDNFLKVCNYFPDKVFLSSKEMYFTLYEGCGETIMKQGIFDLFTFEDNTEEYERMVKRSYVKKFLKH